ncbi:MAG: DUF4038 domain-containing protein [Anaerolineae bacterium]|jgi:hypothetical protein|nr:DUF4038 domain-containing protein [Anaerolineae bacterium]
MITAIQHRMIELRFCSGIYYSDPFKEVKLTVSFTAPDGSLQVIMGYWAGDLTWKVRFAPDQAGEYTFVTACSDASNPDLHSQIGVVTVKPYQGTNRLYRHGRLTVMPDQRHLQFEDGTPFFWLADTWWMGFTERLRFPDEFCRLAADRVQKHFSVIQIVAGLYPDMAWFDERGRNEAGFPWTEQFETINPAYFDMVDFRVAHLVEQGLVPCIVGSWGYFMDFAGMEVLKRHWEYLTARYGAYPVVWCAAGEAMMKYYLADTQLDVEAWAAKRQSQWSALVQHIRAVDGHKRLITIHPTQYGREQVSDPTLIDFEMLQTGHGGYTSLGSTVDMLELSLEKQPPMPVLVSEVNYEGICESAREEVQRFHFWSCVLSGAMGHTYGANGLWQVNTKEKPYGKSPHGTSWGNIPWEEAAALPGSRQLGLGKALLEEFSWWKMEPHPEWISHPATADDRHRCYMSGFPGCLRILYYPANMSWVAWHQEMVVLGLEADVQYQVFYFDPKTGDQYDLGTAANSEYVVPKPPIFQDWVLVLTAG